MMDLNEAQRNVENSRIVKEIDKFRIMLKHFKEYIDKKDQDLIGMRSEVEGKSYLRHLERHARSSFARRTDKM